MKYSFESILVYLKQGKKVRRSGWEKGCYVKLDGASVLFHWADGRAASHGCFWVYEALAEDWEVLDED